MPSTYLIVGASLAGASAAVTLRDEGFDGNLILIGEELHAPYERPPLPAPRSLRATPASKEYLRGEEPFDKALLHPPGFYEEIGVETRFGVRATQVDPSDKVVELDDNDRLQYDKLLITTGSRNRRLEISGKDLEGVCYLRTVGDCDRIRAQAATGRKAVVVGMGFIGCEVTSSLRQLGLEVTAVLPGVPLKRALGEEVGRVIEEFHRDHGIEMLLGDSVTALDGVDHVERATTKRGRLIECDFVVVGVGVEPVTDLLAHSGVELDNGILVDEYCRTNVDGIYAAGDVANHFHPVFERHIRVEHWDNAAKQGAAAAQSMLGKRTQYDAVPWFWSDQYEYNLQYFGFSAEWDELAVRGSLEQRDFVAFYLQGGRLLASAGIGRARDLRRTAALIKAKTSVPTAELVDDEVDLRKLIPLSNCSGADNR
jgi:3-phenylpropionate/trans-cinnamate dioxygenase ferredoxin reductase component